MNQVELHIRCRKSKEIISGFLSERMNCLHFYFLNVFGNTFPGKTPFPPSDRESNISDHFSSPANICLAVCSVSAVVVDVSLAVVDDLVRI